MRTVTAASLATLGGPVTRPGFFVQFEFPGDTVRLCSFGTTTWNSLTWTGANITVDGLQGDGKRARVTVFDADASFRTLALTDGGIRNRTVTIWQGQRAALADTDPNMVFYGAGDSVSIARGQVSVNLARLNSRVMLAPRQRICPATGFNFLAAPGAVIQWGDVQITLERASRG